MISGDPGMNDTDKEWQHKVSGMVKAEMARRNVTYRQLETGLRAIGIEDNAKNLSTKISRGRFTATFFFQCMRVLGCRILHLDNAN
jgi:Domain of unknown function (DUF6471)